MFKFKVNSDNFQLYNKHFNHCGTFFLLLYNSDKEQHQWKIVTHTFQSNSETNSAGLQELNEGIDL